MDDENLGEVEGYLDSASLMEVRGWCWLPKFASIPLLVELRINGSYVAQEIACRYRADLFDAGKRFGACSFVFRNFETPDDTVDADIQVSVVKPVLHLLEKL